MRLCVLCPMTEGERQRQPLQWHQLWHSFVRRNYVRNYEEKEFEIESSHLVNLGLVGR